MTLRTPAGPALDAAPARARPRLHFTADDGWINDPYGVVWVNDRYHLFYQAVSGRVTWAPECGWGHAEATDLVRWTEQSPALAPQSFELGCWSGSVIADAPGGPTLFYTRVVGDDWARGVIATAYGSPDLRDWTTGIDDVVIDGPPAELGVHTFRDPFVFRHGDEWVMVVGAGLTDGSGGAVQYRSSDLKMWTCDGLLCSGPGDGAGEVWTGAMWECPQLFPLGDDWVLLVSVWNDDVLHYVAAAVGDYDGRRFVPHGWQRLTHGSCAYAMSAFTDRDGRRCVLSWLREEPQNNPELTERAGAHSLVAVVSRTDDGRLALSPHPDLAEYGRRRVVPAAGTGPTRLPCGPAAVDLSVVPAPGLRLVVATGDAERAVVEFADDELRLVRPGFPAARMPVGAGRELRIVLDADLLEVFGPGGYGAFRIVPAFDPDGTEIVVSAPHPELAVRTTS